MRMPDLSTRDGLCSCSKAFSLISSFHDGVMRCRTCSCKKKCKCEVIMVQSGSWFRGLWSVMLPAVSPPLMDFAFRTISPPLNWFNKGMRKEWSSCLINNPLNLKDWCFLVVQKLLLIFLLGCFFFPRLFGGVGVAGWGRRIRQRKKQTNSFNKWNYKPIHSHQASSIWSRADGEQLLLWSWKKETQTKKRRKDKSQKDRNKQDQALFRMRISSIEDLKKKKKIKISSSANNWCLFILFLFNPSVENMLNFTDCVTHELHKDGSLVICVTTGWFLEMLSIWVILSPKRKRNTLTVPFGTNDGSFCRLSFTKVATKLICSWRWIQSCR